MSSTACDGSIASRVGQFAKCDAFARCATQCKVKVMSDVTSYFFSYHQSEGKVLSQMQKDYHSQSELFVMFVN